MAGMSSLAPLQQLLALLLGPAHAGNGAARAKNLGVSLWLAALCMPGFAAVYLYFGEPRAALASVLALGGVGASALALYRYERVAIARGLLGVTVYMLLLSLIYLIGGPRSPSLVWLVVCPMLASAGGGARRGLFWSGIIMVTMVLVGLAGEAGLFPPPAIRDLASVTLIGNAAFVAVVAVFLLIYERNNAAAYGQLKMAMETIQLMAVSDELTGLINRRELLRLAQQEKCRADRYGVPLSYCLVDIDHFKVVNDTWGHIKGDAVLRGVAGVLQQLARASDCVGRYGGEEFVFVLSDTDCQGACDFAERVRAALEQQRYPDMDDLCVTLSIGVAQDLPSQTVEQGLARADSALYEAKRSGRNRVVASGLRAAA